MATGQNLRDMQMAMNTANRFSDITAIEPLSISTASVIIEDWLGDELGTVDEHWEAEAYTLVRARPQIESMFDVYKYHLTVATAAIMGMETGDDKDAFVWLIDDCRSRQTIATGYAGEALSAQHDCESRMHEIAARDRA